MYEITIKTYLKPCHEALVLWIGKVFLFMKFCNTCFTCKEEKLFRPSKKNKDGIEGSCKKCRAKRNLELRHIKTPLKPKNPIPLAERKRIYARNNYHANKEICKKKNQEYCKKRKLIDPLFKLKGVLRTRINIAIRRSFFGRKSKGTAEILGGNFDVVKKYIERQFKKGMTWKNHGNGIDKWNIDHKIPLSSAKTEHDLLILCHYTNLQPLWSKENLRKYNKMPNSQIIMNL